MSGEEFYTKHKGKMVIIDNIIKGRVVGYNIDENNIIITVKSGTIGWSSFNHFGDVILSNRDNEMRFWYVWDDNVKKIIPIIYGRG